MEVNSVLAVCCLSLAYCWKPISICGNVCSKLYGLFKCITGYFKWIFWDAVIGFFSYFPTIKNFVGKSFTYIKDTYIEIIKDTRVYKYPFVYRCLILFIRKFLIILYFTLDFIYKQFFSIAFFFVLWALWGFFLKNFLVPLEEDPSQFTDFIGMVFDFTIAVLNTIIDIWNFIADVINLILPIWWAYVNYYVAQIAFVIKVLTTIFLGKPVTISTVTPFNIIINSINGFGMLLENSNTEMNMNIEHGYFSGMPYYYRDLQEDERFLKLSHDYNNFMNENIENNNKNNKNNNNNIEEKKSFYIRKLENLEEEFYKKNEKTKNEVSNLWNNYFGESSIYEYMEEYHKQSDLYHKKKYGTNSNYKKYTYPSSFNEKNIEIIHRTLAINNKGGGFTGDSQIAFFSSSFILIVEFLIRISTLIFDLVYGVMFLIAELIFMAFYFVFSLIMALIKLLSFFTCSAQSPWCAIYEALVMAVNLTIDLINSILPFNIPHINGCSNEEIVRGRPTPNSKVSCTCSEYEGGLFGGLNPCSKNGLQCFKRTVNGKTKYKEVTEDGLVKSQESESPSLGCPSFYGKRQSKRQTMEDGENNDDRILLLSNNNNNNIVIENNIKKISNCFNRCLFSDDVSLNIGWKFEICYNNKYYIYIGTCIPSSYNMINNNELKNIDDKINYLKNINKEALNIDLSEYKTILHLLLYIKEFPKQQNENFYLHNGVKFNSKFLKKKN